MKKILLGTPSYDGKLTAQYVHSLLQTISLGYKLGFNVMPVFLCDDALIQRARNDLFAFAHEHKVDYLFFIDADIFWNAEDFFKLINSDKEIIGAPVIKKSDEKIDFNIKIFDNQIFNEKENIETVQSVGTGFLRISKEAINKIWMYSKSYKENNKDKKMVFDVSVIDGQLYSEDTLFCYNWYKNKGEIFIDKNIIVGHTGKKNYIGNFDEFSKEFNKVQKEG